MNQSVHHPHENQSNAARDLVARREPRALRTFTPSQAVLAASAGVFHWTAEGRRLYDFTSGVLVANLGHNPREWMQRFMRHMNWPATAATNNQGVPAGYFQAVAMTAYNAVTPLEIEATRR